MPGIACLYQGNAERARLVIRAYRGQKPGEWCTFGPTVPLTRWRAPWGKGYQTKPPWPFRT